MTVKKILIVDDDRELCEELAELLNGEDYSAVCVIDAKQGENLIREGKFDAAIIDQKMGGRTGVEILKKLKEDGLERRIILISGRPFIEKEIEAEGLSGMVKGVIAKPINLEKLLEEIAKL